MEEGRVMLLLKNIFRHKKEIVKAPPLTPPHTLYFPSRVTHYKTHLDNAV